MATPQTGRGAVLLGVTGAHLLLGAVWLVARAVVPPTPPTAMTLLSFPAPAAPAEPSPSVPADPVNANVPEPQVTITAASVIAVSDTTACAPLDVIKAALAAEPAVSVAIAAVPASARSVAQAIVIWNADWAAAAATADAPLTRIREIVTHTLAAMPAQCLAQPVIGPRLILIDGGTQTSVLAFGSGTWRWSDLAAAPVQHPSKINLSGGAYAPDPTP